jgi:hypothetical protein
MYLPIKQDVTYRSLSEYQGLFYNILMMPAIFMVSTTALFYRPEYTQLTAVHMSYYADSAVRKDCQTESAGGIPTL